MVLTISTEHYDLDFDVSFKFAAWLTGPRLLSKNPFPFTEKLYLRSSTAHLLSIWRSGIVSRGAWFTVFVFP